MTTANKRRRRTLKRRERGLPTGTPSKWMRYEQYKQTLRKRDLTSVEYETALSRYVDANRL